MFVAGLIRLPECWFFYLFLWLFWKHIAHIYRSEKKGEGYLEADFCMFLY